ncbi:MAG: carboxyl transferase domain-containing protein [Rhodospirillales bacterium]
MSWKPEADEIARRRQWAEAMGGEERVRGYHERGYLTIRERIGHLTDKGSFQEVGKLAGKATYDENGNVQHVVPMPYVMGLAKIDGRPVAVGGEDTTIPGGTSMSGSSWRIKGGQSGFVDDLACEYKIPLVRLCSGYGGSVGSTKKLGYAALPGHTRMPFQNTVELLETVPVVSAVMGTAAGGPAGRVMMSHFTIMTKKSSIFAAGPPVVERGTGEKVTKEELGGWRIAVNKAGTIDNVAEDDEDCLRQIKRFLSYMPQNVWELPPVVDTGDRIDRCEDELLDIIPRDTRKPYNMHHLIEMIVDKDSAFEVQPTYGRAGINMLARLNGKVVGIIANNPMLGGVVDIKSARKQTRFIELCDCFHIPILFIVDVPGYGIGVEAEMNGVLREGMRQLYVKMQATVPKMSLIVRRCFGMAGGTTLDKTGLNFKIAWPSATWGSLPVEGGVSAAYKHEIENAPDPEKRRAEIEAELKSLSSPFRTAEAFAIEDVIDPRETRPYLCQFFDAMQGKLKLGLGPKKKGGVRP